MTCHLAALRKSYHRVRVRSVSFGDDIISKGEEMASKQKTSPVVLGEDWLALIVGLILTALVWIGVIVKIPWPVFGWLK